MFNPPPHLTPRQTNWQESAIIGGIVLGIFAFVGLLVWGIIAAADPGPRPSPTFQPGETVRMKAFASEGMVVNAWCSRGDSGCFYSVRFSALQMRTDVGLFGRDGPIDFAPVALVSGIREFELEKVR